VESEAEAEEEEKVIPTKKRNSPAKSVKKASSAKKKAKEELKATDEVESEAEAEEEEKVIPTKKRNSPAKSVKKASSARKAVEERESADEDEGMGEDSENDVIFAEVSNGFKKSVIIEHCKQCNAFKTRALQVQQYLQKVVPGLEVVINPEKPRRGCFEIRDGEGNIFISLLGMPRPFTKMKALDMDETAASIVEQLK